MSAAYGETVMTANSRREAGKPGRPMLIAALGAACISSSAILVTLARTPAATTAFYRCALALPILVVLAAIEQRRHGPRPLRARLQAVLAGLFLAVDLVLWNHSIADVGAGVATVLGNLQVLFVALLAWLLLRERPGNRYLVMLPVVLLGVVLVSGMFGKTVAGLHPAAGVGFGIATSAAYACFLLIIRQTAGRPPGKSGHRGLGSPQANQRPPGEQRHHVAGQLADATAAAAAGSLLIGLMFGGMRLEIGWHSLFWLLVLALLSQTAGWLLITSTLPKLPAAMSSLLLLLQPAAALVLAGVVLGERPTLIQVAGAALVCSGVLAATWTRLAPRPRTAAAGRLASELPAASAYAGTGPAGVQAVTANRT
jgi:drug/metabolite transporter (DMT)-like permease